MWEWVSLFIVPSLEIFLPVCFVKFWCVSFYFILFIIQKELNKSANLVIWEVLIVVTQFLVLINYQPTPPNECVYLYTRALYERALHFVLAIVGCICGNYSGLCFIFHFFFAFQFTWEFPTWIHYICFISSSNTWLLL